MKRAEGKITTGKATREYDEDDSDETNHKKSNERDIPINGEKLIKAKRHDIDPPPVADVDLKLAEKLDSLLSLGSDTVAQRTAKPRFFLHKLKYNDSKDNIVSKEKILPLLGSDELSTKLKPRNLTKDELKDRLSRKYDTLVPELDPERPKDIKVIKILSAKESIELAKEEARKQLKQQMKLGSISGNQEAHIQGIESFKFNDGYEIPER